MRKLYIACGLITTLLLGGCKGYLDEMPDNRVQVDTVDDIKKLLVNAYPLATPAVIYELSSDNTDDIGADNPYYSNFSHEVAYWDEILEYGYSDGLSALWQAHYKAISQANLALETMERMGNTEEMKPLRGEALVARAYAHFVLINTFANHYSKQAGATDLGLPYMEATERELDPKYGRGTVADFYAKVARDLEEGLPLIDDKSYRKPKYHFNRRAAYAFAARFYLYYEQWDKAVACANEVLGATQPISTDLMRSWSVFRTIAADNDSQAKEYSRVDSPANIMLQTVKSDAYRILNISYSLLRFSHSKRNATTETMATANIWGSGYDTYLFRTNVSDRSDLYNRVSFPKYPYFSSSSSSTIIVPFTTEETLLVRAEANALLGKYQEAMADLNSLTASMLNSANTTDNKTTFTLEEVVAFYKGISYSTASQCTQKKTLSPKFALSGEEQEALLHYILQCRRIMTLHDGLRWLDVRRYGIEVVRYQHDSNNKKIFHPKATLAAHDLRKTIQLPTEVRSAGLAPNPR